MTILAAGAASTVLLELGAVLLALGVLGRLAANVGLPAIPLYLLAGLAVGEGGFYSLDASVDFIATGADIGVVLLLLMLGLEYSTDELMGGLRTQRAAGMVDAVANFTPGFVIGLLLGWGPLAATLLGGVTYVSSSGIIARLLEDFERLGNRETPVVLSLLVIEDLAMAVYLPVVAGLLIGDGPGRERPVDRDRARRRRPRARSSRPASGRTCRGSSTPSPPSSCCSPCSGSRCSSPGSPRRSRSRRPSAPSSSASRCPVASPSRAARSSRRCATCSPGSSSSTSGSRSTPATSARRPARRSRWP